jgi:hypothetical protein
MAGKRGHRTFRRAREWFEGSSRSSDGFRKQAQEWQLTDKAVPARRFELHSSGSRRRAKFEPRRPELRLTDAARRVPAKIALDAGPRAKFQPSLARRSFLQVWSGKTEKNETSRSTLQQLVLPSWSVWFLYLRESLAGRETLGGPDCPRHTRTFGPETLPTSRKRRSENGLRRASGPKVTGAASTRGPLTASSGLSC